MRLFHLERASRQIVVKGILAGLVGGAAGSGMKLVGELVYPPRTEGQGPPPAILAQKLAGRPLSQTEKTAATQTIHWITGSLVGAVYGGLAELAPVVTAGYGVGLGWALLLATHESTLPLLGLSKPPLQQPLQEQGSEIATHALFGVSVEFVRRRIRARSALKRSGSQI